MSVLEALPYRVRVILNDHKHLGSVFDEYAAVVKTSEKSIFLRSLSLESENYKEEFCNTLYMDAIKRWSFDTHRKRIKELLEIK